jgi:hypothetical protein
MCSVAESTRTLARTGECVQGKVKEQWMQLCEQAAVEQDSERLMKLVTEITRMLDEKEERLQQVSPDDLRGHPKAANEGQLKTGQRE